MIFSDQRLERLVYVSAATRELSPAELVELGRKARRNNAERRVTGMLLYIEGEFFEILEGPSAAVEETFARICADERNEWATPLIREHPFLRAFRSWSMGAHGLPFRELSGEHFFEPDWEQVRRRANSDRLVYFGFLERFCQAGEAVGRASDSVRG